MYLIKLFFKIIYILRKKTIAATHTFLKLEYKFLFPGRIEFLSNLKFSSFPVLEFDESGSQLVLHKNVSIRGSVRFLFKNNGVISINENTFFNNNCSINCLESILIGKNCLFGEGVKIYDHNHKYKDKLQLIVKQGYTTAPVIIGSNCWIGSNTTILKGVSIGNNCIIGANCVIQKSVPDNSIVYANANNLIVKSY